MFPITSSCGCAATITAPTRLTCWIRAAVLGFGRVDNLCMILRTLRAMSSGSCLARAAAPQRTDLRLHAIVQARHEVHEELGIRPRPRGDARFLSPGAGRGRAGASHSSPSSAPPLPPSPSLAHSQGFRHTLSQSPPDDASAFPLFEGGCRAWFALTGGRTAVMEAWARVFGLLRVCSLPPEQQQHPYAVTAGACACASCSGSTRRSRLERPRFHQVQDGAACCASPMRLLHGHVPRAELLPSAGPPAEGRPVAPRG